MPYEVAPRKLHEALNKKEEGVQRLPIKLQDGRIQKTGKSLAPLRTEAQSDTDDSDHGPVVQEPIRDSAVTGARFGRLAVVDILENKSRKARIQAAKDQIASICQEVVSDPENSVGGFPYYDLLSITYNVYSSAFLSGYIPSLYLQYRRPHTQSLFPTTLLYKSWRFYHNWPCIRILYLDTVSVP